MGSGFFVRKPTDESPDLSPTPCPYCREPMQTYVGAPHVVRSARVYNYCPSCALVATKSEETSSTASFLASR